MQYLETLGPVRGYGDYRFHVRPVFIAHTCISAANRMASALKTAGRGEVKVVGRGRESNKSTLELCNNAIGVETFLIEAYLSALLRIRDDSQKNVDARVFIVQCDLNKGCIQQILYCNSSFIRCPRFLLYLHVF